MAKGRRDGRGRLGALVARVAARLEPDAGFAGSAPPRPRGFAEDQAGLRDLDARLPPPDAVTMPAAAPRVRAHPAAPRLSRDASAGGGYVTDADGTRRPHYHGHRARLRERFLGGGSDALPDYELLELMLFDAIPRIDVKPLAKRLLARFGDIARVVAATEAQILSVDGATPRVFLQLRIVEAFAQRLGRARLKEEPVLASWDALVDYCRTAMGFRQTEAFRVLFLDRKNRLVADEELGQGTVGHVPVYPREVARRALEVNASAIILVHNHPSGDPEPSEEDVVMTDAVVRACAALDIPVHDHIVIGAAGEASLRSLGLM